MCWVWQYQRGDLMTTAEPLGSKEYVHGDAGSLTIGLRSRRGDEVTGYAFQEVG
jgi:hypothetical protein